MPFLSLSSFFFYRHVGGTILSKFILWILLWDPSFMLKTYWVMGWVARF